jgi:hypothetical protein
VDLIAVYAPAFILMVIQDAPVVPERDFRQYTRRVVYCHAASEKTLNTVLCVKNFHVKNMMVLI